MFINLKAVVATQHTTHFSYFFIDTPLPLNRTHTHTHTHTHTPPPTPSLPFLPTGAQVNKKGKSQLRTMIVTEQNIYKYDPKKYVVRKVGIPLAYVESISVSPGVDTVVVVHMKEPERDIVLGNIGDIGAGERLSGPLSVQ